MPCGSCVRRADWPSYVSNAVELQPGMFEKHIKDGVVEAMFSQCFLFQGLDRVKPHFPDIPFTLDSKPVDYFVDIEYEEELHENWVTPEGHNVLKSARLSVSLFYNGVGGRELVDSWSIMREGREEGDLRPDSLPDSWQGVKVTVRGMCSNRRSILRQLRPIEDKVLKDFERRPTYCEVELERDVCPGEEVDITISKIIDSNGSRSREFNRIVVTALEGEITGGVELDDYPKYYAFLVGEEPIKFTYKASEEAGIGRDKLTVFNSCDISRVDQYPLGKTMPKDEIRLKRIEIKACADAIIRVTGSEVVTEKGEITSSVGAGSNTFRRDYFFEIEASADLRLKQTRTLPMPMYNEYYEYYKVIGVELVGFRVRFKDEEYSFNKRSDGWTEKTDTWEGTGENGRLTRISMMMLEMREIYAIFDMDTKWVKAVLAPGPGVEYVFRRQLLQEGQSQSPSGLRSYTHEDVKEDDEIFGIEKVDEPKQGYNVSNIPSPDYIATRSEVDRASGGGKVLLDTCSHSSRDYTVCRTEKSFSWDYIRINREK